MIEQTELSAGTSSGIVNVNTQANTVLNAISGLISISTVHNRNMELEAENNQLKLDLHLAEVKLNSATLQSSSLQSRLDACEQRKDKGHGIHDVNDLPAVIAGDLIVTEDGGLQDPETGLRIDP